MTEDPVLMERVHAKVNEAYMTLTAALEEPEKFSNPLTAMLTFTHIVEALKAALSLLEGDG
ncbi:MAG: hypothetical protein LN413_00425 [Candidatus Thermoplasmatota archaeon]|nr:hypothetical protein [Candidatus Thermoplasmatota archaeon]